MLCAEAPVSYRIREDEKRRYMNKNKIIVPKAESVRLLPVTEQSHPFGGTAWTTDPTDLESFGYIEEEYVIKGNAHVYTWPSGQRYPEVLLEPSPYASRILVRKPADPEKFSGNVIVEMFNWARGYDRPIALWSNCYEHLMESGDGWVGVSIRGEVLTNLKKFDPVRYAELSMENPLPEEERYLRPQAAPFHGQRSNASYENGLSLDLFSQTAMAVREQEEGYPFAGYDVKTVIGTGATPGDLATYACAIDPVCCSEEGKNIYDGFLIFMTGAPANVNGYEDKLHHLDERCRFYGKVPLMRAYTCKDMLGTGMHPDWALMQRRPDSNEPGAYYRSYEIAGTGLMLNYVYRNEPVEEDISKMGLKVKNGNTGKAWTEEELNRFEFPTRYALNAMLENLKLWIKDNTAPPSTEGYETEGVYPDIDLKDDENGNVLGGLRLPYLRVPAYEFRKDALAVPLPKDKLIELYGDYNHYLELFTKAVSDCVREQILLESDAEKVLMDAERVKAFFE